MNNYCDCKGEKGDRPIPTEELPMPLFIAAATNEDLAVDILNCVNVLGEALFGSGKIVDEERVDTPQSVRQTIDDTRSVLLTVAEKLGRLCDLVGVKK